MHSCFRDARHPTPPSRVFRVRGPTPLNCMDAEGVLYPLNACFADINFTLFVMNIQHLISSNQLSNVICDFRKFYILLYDI